MHISSDWKIQHRRQLKITDNTKLMTTQKKQTTQNTAKRNYPGFVASYNNRPENEVGLFYNVSQPTRGRSTWRSQPKKCRV